MKLKIEVKLPDGQVVVYYSAHERKEDVAAEVGRLFPLAQSWRRAAKTPDAAPSFFSFSSGSAPNRRLMMGGILAAICALLLVAGDDIYAEIRYQILMHQLRRLKVDMITSLGSSVATATSEAEATQRDIKVLSSSDQSESSDTRSVAGEVQNTGNRSYDYVNVQVTFYNSSGAVVDTKRDYVEPKTLAPGEKASFKVQVNSDRNYTHYAVAVFDRMILGFP